jgi:hypothetical protein
MSFINSLSSGEKGIRGQRGARGDPGDTGPIGLTGNTGNTGDPGVDGNDGSVGNTGPQGPQGTNAGPNPTFTSVDVETLNFENSLKNNGNKILQSTSMQLNSSWRDIPDIGNRFTGIVTLTPQNDNLSCGTFAVSNSSTTNNSGLVNELSVQGDDSDSTKRVRLGYVGGILKATKDNEGGYQIYNVSYFGFH